MKTLAESVDVAILAGGLGTRLRSVVSDRPKVLAPVCGRPFLHYWLDRLTSLGLDRIVLCTGYQADKVRQTVGDRFGKATLIHSLENQPLGTAGALRQACAHFKRDIVLVVNGDSFCDVDLRAFWNSQLEVDAPLSMTVTWVDDASRYGRVELSCLKEVVGFREKQPGSGAGWINAGVYLIRKETLHSIPEGCAASLERDLLPKLLTGRIHGFPTKTRFIDIGTPESFAEAQTFFAGWKH